MDGGGGVLGGIGLPEAGGIRLRDSTGGDGVVDSIGRRGGGWPTTLAAADDGGKLAAKVRACVCVL
jgi:hypothetical protein